jgi:hypothetical protein
VLAAAVYNFDGGERELVCSGGREVGREQWASIGALRKLRRRDVEDGN